MGCFVAIAPAEWSKKEKWRQIEKPRVSLPTELLQALFNEKGQHRRPITVSVCRSETLHFIINTQSKGQSFCPFQGNVFQTCSPMSGCEIQEFTSFSAWQSSYHYLFSHGYCLPRILLRILSNWFGSLVYLYRVPWEKLLQKGFPDVRRFENRLDLKEKQSPATSSNRMEENGICGNYFLLRTVGWP